MFFHSILCFICKKLFVVTGLVELEIIGRAKHGVPLLVVGQHTKSSHLTPRQAGSGAQESHSPQLFREETVKGADSDGLMVSSQI